MVLAISLVDDHIVYMCCQRISDFMTHVMIFKLFEKNKNISYYDIKSHQCASLCEKGRCKLQWFIFVMKYCFFQGYTLFKCI